MPWTLRCWSLLQPFFEVWIYTSQERLTMSWPELFNKKKRRKVNLSFKSAMLKYAWSRLCLYVWIYENDELRPKRAFLSRQKSYDIKIKRKVSPFFLLLLAYLPFIALLSLFFARFTWLEEGLKVYWNQGEIWMLGVEFFSTIFINPDIFITCFLTQLLQIAVNASTLQYDCLSAVNNKCQILVIEFLSLLFSFLHFVSNLLSMPQRFFLFLV